MIYVQRDDFIVYMNVYILIVVMFQKLLIIDDMVDVFVENMNV